MSLRDVLKRIRASETSALGRRLGATQLGVWVIKHLISPLHRRIYRLTGGRWVSIGKSLGPILLLTTKGRRTGKEHTTPLFYLRDDERLIICNVNPGFERPNPWTLNLRAHPLVRVQIGQEISIYLAREATEEELGRYWPRLVEICQRTRHTTIEADNVSSSCSNRTLGKEYHGPQSCHRRWSTQPHPLALWAMRPSRTSFS